MGTPVSTGGRPAIWVAQPTSCRVGMCLRREAGGLGAAVSAQIPAGRLFVNTAAIPYRVANDLAAAVKGGFLVVGLGILLCVRSGRELMCALGPRCPPMAPIRHLTFS
jgi:hypothetical protein